MEPPVDGEGPKLLCWCADVMVDDDELDKAHDESESLLFSVPCRGCKRGDEDDDASPGWPPNQGARSGRSPGDRRHPGRRHRSQGSQGSCRTSAPTYRF